MSRSVLIAEDDAEIRASVADLLNDAGYRVTCAENGFDALQKLREGSELPGLILLDLMMPTMDGFAFRAAQQRDPTIARVPVVVMSASHDVNRKAEALAACAWLKKPFADLDEILALVQRHCDASEQPTASP